MTSTLPDYLVELLPALKRLDALLGTAVAIMSDRQSAQSAADPYRGLYVDPSEAEKLLHQEPGTPTLWQTAPEEGSANHLHSSSRLAWLRDAYQLSQFELDVLLITLAPELDRRYERLYAYLQDHVGRRWPTVDLVLNLLCPDAAARIKSRAAFDPDASLFRHRLVHVTLPAGDGSPSLLSSALRLDGQVTRFLLRQDGLDARLARYCRLISSDDDLDDTPLDAHTQGKMVTWIEDAWEYDRPLRLYFHGLPGSGRRRAAAALAAHIGANLLAVDLQRALAGAHEFDLLLKLIFRYAWFYGAIPYFEGSHVLGTGQYALQRSALLEQLTNDLGITILSGTQPWTRDGRFAPGLLEVHFTLPRFSLRRALWKQAAQDAGIDLASVELDELAGRFRLTPLQIADAVATAATGRIDLFTAARRQSGNELGALAQKIDPLYSWDDIVLPEDALNQLREICQRVRLRHRVLGEWGFNGRLSLGKGTAALFAGPSGTGKTMAAEVIANDLALDLYRIDLAGVVSKYIGETEKNLDRIFSAAENANAILFFDEADALFGKRSEVRDSHDRYANIEISYLLQKMESYDGLAILATNMRQNLDEAFIRRLAFAVAFPFPDEASRRRIWHGIWPGATPLATEVDLDWLAKEFRLSGGNIKNNALAAAYLAAADGGEVTMDHLLHATRREYQKMGKHLSESELAVTKANGTK